MNIYPTILKSKPLKDGSHKLRLAISHNGATRYIGTRFIIPSERNINDRGQVTGLADASIINRKVSEQIRKLYDIYDSITSAYSLTCSQLVSLLESNGVQKPTRINELEELWLQHKANTVKEQTIDLMRRSLRSFKEYVGEDFLLSSLNPNIISSYLTHLRKFKFLQSTGYSNVSILIKFEALKSFVSFCVKRGLVTFPIDPFIDLRLPQSNKREVALPIDIFRKVMRYETNNLSKRETRDLFLLSFYMCGMNLADLVKVDFSKSSVKFRRTKTDRRRRADEYTEFSIDWRAKAIFAHLRKDEENPSKLNMYYKRKSFTDEFRAIAKAVSDEPLRICMYSARKSFAQYASELDTQDRVIEYLLGDAQSSSVISFYRKVTKKIADATIQKVFDFVDSGLSTEEYMKTILNNKQL